MEQPKLIFITGTMTSGKSAELIDRIEGYFAHSPYRHLTIKPAVDTRDGAFVATRKHNRKKPAILVDDENEMHTGLILGAVEQYGAIFIDEVQFFDKEFIRKLADRCDTFGTDLIVSGLTRNFKGEYFPASWYLEAYADEVIELKGKCFECKNDNATIVVRMDAENTLITDGEVVVPEGQDNGFHYESLCKDCHAKKLLEVM